MALCVIRTATKMNKFEVVGKEGADTTTVIERVIVLHDVKEAIAEIEAGIAHPTMEGRLIEP
jgi:hypothetical protein